MTEKRLSRIFGKRSAFFEGPTYGTNGVLYFSNYRGKEIWGFDGEDGPRKIVEIKNKSSLNGLFVTRNGTVWACDMKRGRIVTVDMVSGVATGRACEFGGNDFDDPNDLIMDSHGGVYFSCPGIWPLNWPWEKKAKHGVYYLQPTGRKPKVSQLLTCEIAIPNGVMLSPDESTLYVVQHRNSRVYKFDLPSPGKVANQEKFCDLYDGERNDGGDGLTVDVSGNVYIATTVGVEVFSKNGKSLELIRLPTNSIVDHVSNVTFGGKRRDTLFATAYSRRKLPGWSGLFAIQLKGVAGHMFPGKDMKRPTCS